MEEGNRRIGGTAMNLLQAIFITLARFTLIAIGLALIPIWKAWIIYGRIADRMAQRRVAESSPVRPMTDAERDEQSAKSEDIRLALFWGGIVISIIGCCLYGWLA